MKSVISYLKLKTLGDVLLGIKCQLFISQIRRRTANPKVVMSGYINTAAYVALTWHKTDVRTSKDSFPLHSVTSPLLNTVFNDA